jgi:hypothetical protein
MDNSRKSQTHSYIDSLSVSNVMETGEYLRKKEGKRFDMNDNVFNDTCKIHDTYKTRKMTFRKISYVQQSDSK